MNGYLGEEIIDVKDTTYKDYTEKDWVLEYIMMYGGIDGAHHKDWLIDQIVHILKGAEIITKIAKWDNGHTEIRVSLGPPTHDYLKFVADYEVGEDGPNTYSYDEGIAP